MSPKKQRAFKSKQVLTKKKLKKKMMDVQKGIRKQKP